MSNAKICRHAHVYSYLLGSRSITPDPGSVLDYSCTVPAFPGTSLWCLVRLCTQPPSAAVQNLGISLDLVLAPCVSGSNVAHALSSLVHNPEWLRP